MNAKEIEEGLAQTNKFIGFLNNQEEDNIEWQQEFDRTFLTCVFDHDSHQPFFVGPDGSRYFAFKLPPGKGHTISVASPKLVLSQMVEWASGAAILTSYGETAYVFSPGDIVSLALSGVTHVKWKGGWAEEPDYEFYRSGGEASVARPNEQMFPPLVARCLDLYLRWYFSGQSQLADRTPSIALIRPSNHIHAEDASDLMLNVFLSDFPNESDAGQFLTWIDHFVPRHLRLRIFMQDSNYLSPSEFTPLETIYLEAGLQPAPQ